MRLLSRLKECRDLSCSSKELALHINDWPSEYHLSSIRHNLLKPITFSCDHRILELGSGCGAITRYLGETGAEVVAIEGSARRSSIGRERCRDLPNVQVVCDNLVSFNTEQRYDFVTLIGVLEYAPRYIVAEDPIAACLKRAAAFLKPDGVLIVAIENQLGLKYFNGCAEDHLGAAYYGLHGLYRDDEPTTFGRAALERRLGEASLPHHRFFYPFPDYKLPQVILSDGALSTPGFDAAALLAGMASGNAESEFHPNFHENLAWRPIIENGLLPQLANSFLILAAESEDALGKFETGWLACTYTTGRIPAYATETRFSRSNKAVLVEKRRLHPDIPAPRIDFSVGRLFHQPDAVCNYIVGRPFILELQQRLGRDEGVGGVVEWAAPWLDLLLAHAEGSENGMILPGDWVDAIPQNFICESGGNLRRIDDEWRIEGAVSLAWVVIRGLTGAIGMSPTSTRLGCFSLQELIQKVAATRGFDLDEAAFRESVECEVHLQTVVRVDSAFDWRQYLEKQLSQPPCHQLTYPLLQNQRRELMILRELERELEREIARIKSTVSWQVTKPLRLLAHLWRNLKRMVPGSHD